MCQSWYMEIDIRSGSDRSGQAQVMIACLLYACAENMHQGKMIKRQFTTCGCDLEK
jgi:hypothetical protein